MIELYTRHLKSFETCYCCSLRLGQSSWGRRRQVEGHTMIKPAAFGCWERRHVLVIETQVEWKQDRPALKKESSGERNRKQG